jgi:uncharacterized protein (DUF302 family)
MSYCFSTILSSEMEPAIEKVTEALAASGFGVLTQIDVAATLKKKIDVDFRPYMILGACNPGFAHKALLAEDKIGTMLPCNVIIQQIGEGKVEVSAVDPMASMKAVENPDLGTIATEVQAMLKDVIDNL